MFTVTEQRPVRRVRHNGRGSQILIYLGKQLRFFINESDWKVLPMAGIIAALVTMVIRKRFFQNMEGDLLSAFALACVAIWNGSFNSIQAVCRERQIVKREHRAGLHISAYMLAHMIYQLFLCAMQTGITLFVMVMLGDYESPGVTPMKQVLLGKGFMTPLMALDIGITMLLITYAADMMSLLISSFTHTTTGAMTVMPFVLIFQLIFAGSLIPLPAWSKPLSSFTISNYGIRALTSQAGYNESVLITPLNTLDELQDRRISGEVSLGQMIDYLQDPVVQRYRDRVILPSTTYGQALKTMLQAMELDEEIYEDAVASGFFNPDGTFRPVTLGDVIDYVSGSAVLRQRRDLKISYNTSVGELMELIGKDRVREIVRDTTTAASHKPEYERTVPNIVKNWAMLGLFIVVFAGLATLILEMIDHDKR